MTNTTVFSDPEIQLFVDRSLGSWVALMIFTKVLSQTSSSDWLFINTVHKRIIQLLQSDTQTQTIIFNKCRKELYHLKQLFDRKQYNITSTLIDRICILGGSLVL